MTIFTGPRTVFDDYDAQTEYCAACPCELTDAVVRVEDHEYVPGYGRRLVQVTLLCSACAERRFPDWREGEHSSMTREIDDARRCRDCERYTCWCVCPEDR